MVLVVVVGEHWKGYSVPFAFGRLHDHYRYHWKHQKHHYYVVVVMTVVTVVDLPIFHSHSSFLYFAGDDDDCYYCCFRNWACEFCLNKTRSLKGKQMDLAAGRHVQTVHLWDYCRWLLHSLMKLYWMIAVSVQQSWIKAAGTRHRGCWKSMGSLRSLMIDDDADDDLKKKQYATMRKKNQIQSFQS